ncbi:MAG: hypothetical protein ABIT37_12885 [Luteolibacter sp.]
MRPINNRLLFLALATLFLPVTLNAQTPAKPARHEMQVRKGRYIRDTAQEIYGHHDFEGMIVLYNNLGQGRSTYAADQLIKLPPIGQIFREAKMDPAYLEVIDEMIAIATEYLEVDRQYFEIVGKTDLKALQVEGRPGSIRVPVSEVTKAKAADLERRLGVTREKLVSGMKKGHSTPNSFLRNLDGARAYLKSVASGVVDENCYDVDMVSQRLGRAFTNALIWTRENYR